MSTPIAYRKPKRGRLVLLFVLSIAAHVGLAMLAIWAGNHLGRVAKPEDELELGMDVILGEEVQELIVAATPPAPPEPPPPEPPPPPPESEPEPPPPDPPMPEPEFVEPTPPPKATPAPKPKVVAKAAPAPPAPPGAKVGPTPRPGVVGGNVAEGKVEGTPGGKKVGPQGWRTPRGPYPPAALQRRIQGTVMVRIVTNAAGRVTSASPSGGDPILQSAARTMALSSWGGAPNSSKTVPVIYTIR